MIERVALYAFLLNLVLAAAKAVLADISKSLAVTASAVDSATDSIASMVIFAGLKLSSVKTRTFPLGLYKIENLISVVMAFFMIFAGYEIARQVFFGLPTPPQVSPFLIALFLFGALVTWVFGYYTLSLGRRTESPTLVAEGKHRQVDVLSTCIVLIALILNFTGIQINFHGIGIDRMAAMLVLIFIAHTSWELLSDGMRMLLDASLDSETLNQVRRIILEQPAVVSINTLVGRNAGRFRFIQTDISMRTDDLQKAHRISESIEEHIRDQIPHVERVLIHFEPYVAQSSILAVPLADRQGNLSTSFGESLFMALLKIRLQDSFLEERRIEKNIYRQIEKGRGIQIAQWLIREGVDELATIDDIQNKGPGYVLANAGVKIHLVTATHLDAVLDSIHPCL